MPRHQPVACEFCGSYTCDFVKHEAGNQAARQEAATQVLEKRAGLRQAPAESADTIARRWAWSDM